MRRTERDRLFVAASSLAAICASTIAAAPLELTRTINPAGSSINGFSAFASTDYLLFWGYDGSTGSNGAIGEPWRSDGTAAGTQLIKTVSGSAAAPYPDGTAFARITGADMFVYDDGINHAQVWRTDGTAPGTYRLSAFAAAEAPTWFVPLGNRLYFLSAAGCTLPGQCVWSSNGTGVAIAMPDISVAGFGVKAVQQTLVFPGYYASHGSGLFASDGTEAGTVKLADTDVSGLDVVAVNDRAFFTNADAEHGAELWVSDLSPEGTQLVADINPGPGDSSPGGIRVGDLLFFVALDPAGGRELWRSDGSAQGTYKVKEIRAGLLDANINSLTAFKPLASAAKAFFYADDGVHGAEPWISDGTPGGTFALADINPGAGSSLAGEYVPLGLGAGLLYFTANDGTATHLWRTDGTVAGTRIADSNSTLADINPLGTAAGRMFVAAYDGSGDQLYAMDLLGDETLAPHGSQWCARPELTIPDTESVTSSVRFPAHGGMTHLDFVTLDIAHTYVGDLTISLTHEETGTSVLLLDQPLDPAAQSCASDLIDISLSDGASTGAEDACSGARNAYAPSGKYKPVQALSAFAGEAVSGHWTLTVIDQSRRDAGTLHQWCMGFQQDFVFDSGFE